MHRNLLFAWAVSLACSCTGGSPRELPAPRPATAPPVFAPNPEQPEWSSPEAAGLNPAALRALVEGAKASYADALVVVKDGRLVLEDRFGSYDGRIEAMSATKSLVSLAVGLLLDDGVLTSVDQPVSDFYPEWREGRKAKVTLRHLLNHTSGLAYDPEVNDGNTPGSDWVQIALNSEVSSEPGTVWTYNNKAVNLLAGIVTKAKGRRMDEYLRDRLFAPLGIADYWWRLDQAGNALGMAGLQIHPRDLARIGEMLADGGMWRGKRIVSAAWIEASALKQSQGFRPDSGLLWWLVGGRVEWGPLIDEDGLAKLRKAGVAPEFLRKVSTLRGQVPRSHGEAIELLQKVLGQDGIILWARETRRLGIHRGGRRVSPATGFMAAGYLGQYLWVSPKEKLVVVCMHRASKKASSTPEYGLLMEFPRFEALAAALVASSGSPSREY